MQIDVHASINYQRQYYQKKNDTFHVVNEIWQVN